MGLFHSERVLMRLKHFRNGLCLVHAEIDEFWVFGWILSWNSVDRVFSSLGLWNCYSVNLVLTVVWKSVVVDYEVRVVEFEIWLIELIFEIWGFWVRNCIWPREFWPCALMMEFLNCSLLIVTLMVMNLRVEWLNVWLISPFDWCECGFRIENLRIHNWCCYVKRWDYYWHGIWIWIVSIRL